MITIGQNVLSQETGYTRKALHYLHISIFEAFRENCDSYECWLWQSCRYWILMLFVIINFTASMFHKYLVCFSLLFLQLYWTDFLLHGSYWTQVWSYPALVKPLLITLSFAYIIWLWLMKIWTWCWCNVSVNVDDEVEVEVNVDCVTEGEERVCDLRRGCVT